MELIFASNNAGKLAEVKLLLHEHYQLRTLKESGIMEALPEPFHTFRENAWSKAGFVSGKTGRNCFAEDSGLVVPALSGAPGVFSARYAGLPSDDARNNQKLLQNMAGITDRNAYYQSVICLFFNGNVYYFEGRCFGTIASGPHGNGGFGYDPLFIPDGYDRTFASFELDEKNKISHRGIAVRKLAAFLNGQL